MAIKRIGSTQALRELPDSPNIEWTEHISATLSYQGTYAACVAGVRQRGTKMAVRGVGNLTVVKCSVRRRAPGQGTLTIELSDALDGGVSAGSQIDIDWGTIERPIETHPRYASLSAEARARIRAWEALDEQYSARKAALQYPLPTLAVLPDPANNAHWGQLTGAAAEMCAKKLKGVEAYLLPAPTVKRTSASSAGGAATRCGRIDAPPVSIPGYVFIKSADRQTRDASGAHQRSEEWLGADAWDTDLYST